MTIALGNMVLKRIDSQILRLWATNQTEEVQQQEIKKTRPLTLPQAKVTKFYPRTENFNKMVYKNLLEMDWKVKR